MNYKVNQRMYLKEVKAANVNLPSLSLENWTRCVNTHAYCIFLLQN